MARFFTLDRLGSLTPGTVMGLIRWEDVDPPELQSHLNYLFPGGVTSHGERYIVKGTTIATNVSPNIELLCEYVRRSNHAERPSRFQSVFGGRTIEEVQAFQALFGRPEDKIWEVEGEESFRADMRFLTLEGSLLAASWFAHQYWAGVPFQLPLWESLLRPPVTAIRAVIDAGA